MNTNRHVNNACRALGAAFALAATIASAGAPEAPQSTPSAPLVLADAGTPMARAASDRRYPPGEAGVRRAAAQGPEALRRYIWRTRMIYNYYYWDFATR